MKEKERPLGRLVQTDRGDFKDKDNCKDSGDGTAAWLHAWRMNGRNDRDWQLELKLPVNLK
jgi:hypothetical protein